MWKTRLQSAKRFLLGGCLLLSLVGCGGSAAQSNSGRGTSETLAAEDAAGTSSAGTGVASEARKQAADDGKYLFAFFWKSQDQSTAAMRKLFDESP